MENISRHIGTKFDLVSQLIDKLNETYPDCDNDFKIELSAIRTRYALCTSHLYFQISSGESGRVAAREEFQWIISSENFLDDLDLLMNRVQLNLGISENYNKKKKSIIVSKNKIPRSSLNEIKSIINQYNGYAVDCTNKTVEQSNEKYDICDDCKTEMTINSDTSELLCTECGKIHELIGTVFDDAQFYNQEGQKAKSGSFNPNRHFRFWMDRILAREPEEELGDKDDPENNYGEKLLSQLRSIVRRDRKILQLLTVDDIRSMLKEIGKTELNKNVPLIMRRLTGVGPPSLPESICQQVEKLFSKAINIGERIRPISRSNRNYYPYYIYKILDSILDEDDENRRILCYIYMQGQDTLDKNDKEWEDICVELPEITWKPTSRTRTQNLQAK